MTNRFLAVLPDKRRPPTTRLDEFDAPSSSLQMNRTGSAGVPSLPESPLAGSIPARTGVTHSLLVVTGHRVRPKDLEASGSNLRIDDLDDSEEEENVYELWSADLEEDPQNTGDYDQAVGPGEVASSANLLSGQGRELEADARAMPGMQNVAAVKRERTEIQVST